MQGDDEIDATPYGERLDVGQHVLHRMLAHLFSCRGGDCMPYASIEQTEIFVDLRRGGYGRAGVTADDALLDSDRRWQTTYPVGLGLCHTPDELTRIRGEALYIAALPLGIECIEGQRTLSRATHACDDDKLPAGDLEVYILEIIDTYVVQEDMLGRILAVGGCGGRSLLI